MIDKIKILYLAANPVDTGHLKLQEEARDLEERIRQGTRREAFEVIHFLAVRPKDLLRGLQEVQPHIMHFSGHGTSNKEIVLQGDDGNSRPVAPEDLAGLVNLFKTNLKVALLNSCYGRRQAEALHQVLDFTMGMDKPISDAGAVSFSATFYQVLASGGSIRQAFESARFLTSMEGRPVFGVSDLLVRDGVDVDRPLVDMLIPQAAAGPLPSPKPEPTQPSPRSNVVNQTLNNSPTEHAVAMAGDNNNVQINGGK
jgi:hypothetical protein